MGLPVTGCVPPDPSGLPLELVGPVGWAAAARAGVGAAAADPPVEGVRRSAFHKSMINNYKML